MLDSLFGYAPPRAPSTESARNRNEVDYSKNPTKLFKRVEGRAWESALERIQSHEVETKIWVVKFTHDGSVSWRRLPLHEACIRKPSPKIMEILLNVNPGAAKKQDGDGRLPLHHACANGASLEVVEQLLVAYPDSIERLDSWRKSPLQIVMAQYFPDPHVMSALNRGIHYYRMQAPAVASSNNSIATRSMYLSPPMAPPSVVASVPMHIESRGRGAAQTNSRDSHMNMGTTSTRDSHMITGLENEIGRFSEKLALNIDKENAMQKRIRMLESEVNKLLGCENDNMRLQSDIRDLENEIRAIKDGFDRERAERKRDLQMLEDAQRSDENKIRAMKDGFDREREEGKRDLQMLEDVQRSEESLRRQVEGMKNEPRVKHLEDQVKDMTHELNEKDLRYDRDIQAMRFELEKVARVADSNQGAAHKMEDECNRAQLELQKMEYQADATKEIIKNLKGSIVDTEKLKRDLESMDRECRDKEEGLRTLAHRLKAAEGENANLREDRDELSRLQGDFRNQDDYIKDIVDKLRRSEDDARRLNDMLIAKETQEKERKEELRVEKMKMVKTVEDCKEDLERSQRKNLDLVRDRDDMEKKLKKTSISLDQTRIERDDFEKRELGISLEVNKLHRTIDTKLGDVKGKWIQEQAKSQHHLERCEKLEIELKQFRGKLEETNSVSSETTRELLNTKRKMEDQEYLIDSLSKKKETFEVELKSANAAKEAFEQKSLAAETKIQQMELLAGKMNTENSFLQDAKDRLQGEKDELASLRQQHEPQQKSMESANAMLVREQRLLAGEKEDLEDAKRKLEDEVSTLNQKIKTLLEEIEFHMNSFNKEKLRFITDKDNFLAEQKQLQDTASSLQEKVDEQKKEITFIHDTFNKEKHLFVKEKEDLYNEKKKMEVMLTALNQQAESIGMDRSSNDVAKGELNDELKKVKSAARKMKRAIQSLEAEKSTLTTTNTNLAHKEAELESEKKQLEAQIGFLVLEAEKMEKDLADRPRTMDAGTIDESDGKTHFLGVQDEFIERQEQVIDQLKEDADAMMDKLKDMQGENELLRTLLDEEDTKSSTSLEELEERLFTLEQTKDAEIEILAQERDDLQLEMQELKDRILMLENQVRIMKSDQSVHSVKIDTLRKDRDRKKKTIQERLAAYETKSCAGSVVAMDKLRARLDKDETMSTVSGMTAISSAAADKASEASETRGWASKARYQSPTARKMVDLEGMFPSSVSMSGLSLAEQSSKRFSDSSGLSLAEYSSRRSSPYTKQGVPTKVTLRPSVIMETRDDVSRRTSM